MSPASSSRRGPKPKVGTRDGLVRAGLTLLHAEGYAATGIQAIVESVGVPKGSFYNHFASKEAFGAEVIDAYFEGGRDRLRAFLARTDLKPLDRLKAYFDDRIAALRAGGFVKGCLLGNFSAEVADHSALMREHLVAHFETWGGLFEDCIAEAQEQKAVGDQFPAALLARFILNSWEGALLRMRAEKSEAPLTEFRQVLFGRLLTP
ncbi:MAG: TetR family transcriptional regulator [Rhodospirillales bacterium]|nr:TetR family transcriptional regulator [Rhodospirillales bacterium]